MLYHLFLLIIVLILSFATDARYMSPNFGPSTMAQFYAFFPALPTSNSLLLLQLKCSQPDVFGKGFQG